MPDDNAYWGTNKYNNEYNYAGPAYDIVPTDNRLGADIEYIPPEIDLTPDDNAMSNELEFQGPVRDWTYDAPEPNTLNYERPTYLPDRRLSTDQIVYNTYAGTDIVAQIVLPDEAPITIGELQTISYSTHRENVPLRILGHVNPISFVRGPRTIAGSLIFTVFNYYAFYRLKRTKKALDVCGVYLLADMLPPFDIVLTFSNESGSFSKMRILGVQIIDEGGTMSVDDLVTEQTYSYMARAIQPMTGYNILEGD